MNRKNLEIGLFIALGMYVYEVLRNLYLKVNFPAALTHVDWLRIVVVGLVSILVLRLVARNKRR